MRHYPEKDTYQDLLDKLAVRSDKISELATQIVCKDMLIAELEKQFKFNEELLILLTKGINCPTQKHCRDDDNCDLYRVNYVRDNFKESKKYEKK